MARDKNKPRRFSAAGLPRFHPKGGIRFCRCFRSDGRAKRGQAPMAPQGAIVRRFDKARLER